VAGVFGADSRRGRDILKGDVGQDPSAVGGAKRYEKGDFRRRVTREPLDLTRDFQTVPCFRQLSIG